PTLENAGGDLLNGRPVVGFNGGQWLRVPNSAALSPTVGATVFSVSSANNGNYAGLLTKFATNAWTDGWGLTRDDPGPTVNSWGTGGAVGAGVPFPQNTYGVFSTVRGDNTAFPGGGYR